MTQKQSLEKIKPEEFSILGMYGRREIFEKRLQEGYTEVAFGKGLWIEKPDMFGTYLDFRFPFLHFTPPAIVAQRIPSLFAFYHPNGKIAILEHRKIEDYTGHTAHVGIRETVYNKKRFERHLNEWSVKLEEKTTLVEILEKWQE